MPSNLHCSVLDLCNLTECQVHLSTKSKLEVILCVTYIDQMAISALFPGTITCNL